MDRLSSILVASLVVVTCEGCSRGEPPANSAPDAGKEVSTMAGKSTDTPLPVQKADQEWRKVLTREQYQVTRQKGTERPFSGKYWKPGKQGVFRCVCCGAALFSSKDQFEAHCGWPSFTQPTDAKTIKTEDDHSHFMHRIEVQCSNCGAHLGHVFDDGPGPTGQRYCINSVALKLEEKKEPGK